MYHWTVVGQCGVDYWRRLAQCGQATVLYVSKATTDVTYVVHLRCWPAAWLAMSSTDCITVLWAVLKLSESNMATAEPQLWLQPDAIVWWWHLVGVARSSLDRPGVLVAGAKVEEARSTPPQRASLLAFQAPHSGDWLLTLFSSACETGRLGSSHGRGPVSWNWSWQGAHLPLRCHCRPVWRYRNVCIIIF